MDDQAPLRRRLLIGAAVFFGLLTVFYALFVLWKAGQNFGVHAYLGRKALGHHFRLYDKTILDAVSVASLGLLVLLILAMGFVRRCPLTGLIAACGVGFAVVGAELLKHSLPRPDYHLPLRIPDKDLLVNTFPSGHTTIATSVCLGFVLVAADRWRPWLGLITGFVVASYATGVLFAGWHRPSDALGGICWGAGVMTVAALLCVYLRGRPADPAQHPRRPIWLSVALALGIYGLVWLAAANGADNYPDADLPFITVTGAIIALAFIATDWFAQTLRTVDWPGHDQRTVLKSSGSSSNTASNPR